MAEKNYSSRTIMLVTIALTIILTIIIWPLSMLGKGGPASSSDDAELRILPVARIEMQKATPISDGKPRSGEAIYTASCQACHAAGIAGAPKTGDKLAWAPRIATGNVAMLKTATLGKGNMPARGGVADLTDAELKAAVDYLVGKAK